MKILRSVLAIMVIGTMAVTLGCSKKDSPTAAPATTTTPMTATQQAAVADIGQSAAASGFGNINTASGFLDGMPKGGKTPPSNWYGPDGSGWYTYYYGGDSATYNYRWMVKLTPDVWGAGTPPVTKVEWKWLYRDTTANHKWYYASCERDLPLTDSLIHGSCEYHVINHSGTYNLSVNFVMTYDHVSMKSGNYGGHFTYTCSYPYFNGTALTTVTLSGEFTFAADGSGTGKMLVGGVETVRYVFTSRNAGYYTLLAENWATQHPFGGTK